MKILNPRLHGILDYVAASALIVAPFILGLSGLALWLSAAAGVALILYSLVTDYGPGIARIIPFRVHLVIDTVAGVTFVVAPFVVGWSGLVAAYYVVMGAGVLLVVAVTSANPENATDIATELT